MEKVFCVNCKHYKPTIIRNYGKCTSQDVIERYTKVISSTSHITGETNSYRVMIGNYEIHVVVEGGISTIYGNGTMDCTYYEPKPPAVSWWKRIKKIFGR